MIDDKTLGDAMDEVQKELDALVKGEGDPSKFGDIRDRVLRMRSQIEASGTNSVYSGHLQNAMAKLAAFDPAFSGVPLPLGPVAVSPGGVHDPTNPSYVVPTAASAAVPSAAKADAPKVEEAPETETIPNPEPMKPVRPPTAAPAPGTTGTFGQTGFSPEGGSPVPGTPVSPAVGAPAAGRVGAQAAVPAQTGAAVADVPATAPWEKK